MIYQGKKEVDETVNRLTPVTGSRCGEDELERVRMMKETETEQAGIRLEHGRGARAHAEDHTTQHNTTQRNTQMGKRGVLFYFGRCPGILGFFRPLLIDTRIDFSSGPGTPQLRLIDLLIEVL